MAVQEIGGEQNACPTEWLVSVFERTSVPSGRKSSNERAVGEQ